MSKTQVPIEKLDSYERELCESDDPVDHAALLMRLMIKNKGFDPDGDWKITDSHMDFGSGDSVVVEQCQVRLMPEVTFKSIRSERFEDGRRTVFVDPNDFLAGLIRGSGDWKRLIDVDGEIATIDYLGVTGEGLIRIRVSPVKE